jgi:DNA-binding HxlR family transcriptional regulator
MSDRGQDSGDDRTSGCPIDYALDIFGDRWTLLVIRDLMFRGKRHFHEIIEAPEGIASNILAARLKKLEASGLISRHPDPDNRRQVVYELTEKGIDLIPVLVEVILWGAKYDAHCIAPADLLRRMRKDRQGVIRELTAKLKERRKAVPGARKARAEEGA